MPRPPSNLHSSPYQFLHVRHGGGGVAVGVEQELGVAVDGDESLDVPVVLHEVDDGLHLGLRVGVGPVVCLRAGAAAGPRPCGEEDGENSGWMAWRAKRAKDPSPFTTPRASPTTWLLGGQRGTPLGLHLDICTTVPILWFLPYWSLGDTKALGEPKPTSWPRRAKPSPSLGTPENLSESETSWRVQPPLCGVNGIALTSKTCVPVAVGVHADAEGARSLGPGLAPHAVLEGQSHLSPCPGLGLRQLWAEKLKQCPGRGLTGHSCPLPTPWKRGQGGMELVQ